jgi:hypothetical protein
MEDVKGNMADPFRMLDFQQRAEHLAFKAGGGNLVAPAQRMVDFVERRVSANLPVNSYLPGCKSIDLLEVLPDWIHARLRKALPAFGRKMKGYYTNEAILVGVESRTSSPIKVPRDRENLPAPTGCRLVPLRRGGGLRRRNYLGSHRWGKLCQWGENLFGIARKNKEKHLFSSEILGKTRVKILGFGQMFQDLVYRFAPKFAQSYSPLFIGVQVKSALPARLRLEIRSGNFS